MSRISRFQIASLMKSIAVALLCLMCLLLAGVDASAEAWRFAVFGDSRGSVYGDPEGDGSVNIEILTEIADAIVAENVEFVLFPGDLISGYSTQSLHELQLQIWRDTMSAVYDAGIGVYPDPGNHEMHAYAYEETAWQNKFSDLPDNGPAGEVYMTYSFTHQNALLVAVNTNDVGGTGQHRVNQTWLDAQFAANSKPHVFVYGHEPAFSVDHADCLDDYPDDRDDFWDSIGAEGGRTYFCGHDHFYNRAKVQDSNDNWIHQMVVGTGGAPLRNWDETYADEDVVGLYHSKTYGYMIVEIDGLDVTMTMMERTGEDTFTATDVFSYTAVPEPATIAMIGLSVITIAGIMRRKLC